MKILFVDLKYDYGIPSRGENIIGIYGFQKSLEKLGHQVVPFYYDDYLEKQSELQEEIIRFADKTEPDLVFFILFQEQISVETIKKLSGKYRTINWFGDDTWRFDGFSKKYADSFTFCITTDFFSIEKYHSIGQKNVIYSQWAAIGEHQVFYDENYKYDVSFIGQAQPYRKWIVSCLRKAGIKIECFGYGWENGPVDSERMSQIFCTSKINLNIGNSISYDVRYLIFSFKGLLMALRNKKNNSQIKARNFEIPYFNGFQLTDYVPTLENYFEIGKEVACYNSVNELTELIKFYLRNDSVREDIKSNGHKRAFKEHNYAARLEKIIDVIAK